MCWIHVGIYLSVHGAELGPQSCSMSLELQNFPSSLYKQHPTPPHQCKPLVFLETRNDSWSTPLSLVHHPLETCNECTIHWKLVMSFYMTQLWMNHNSVYLPRFYQVTKVRTLVIWLHLTLPKDTTYVGGYVP